MAILLMNSIFLKGSVILHCRFQVVLLNEAEGGDSCESRHEERLLRVKSAALRAMFFATLREQNKDALISAKSAEIRQIEPFAVRLAHGPPAESVRL
ncbi:hypothetical protein MHZ92_20415 [Sporosarcina sp. ACRSL]|nr:hypothetical protein [Sporosarcina sp. ACRSL]